MRLPLVYGRSGQLVYRQDPAAAAPTAAADVSADASFSADAGDDDGPGGRGKGKGKGKGGDGPGSGRGRGGGGGGDAPRGGGGNPPSAPTQAPAPTAPAPVPTPPAPAPINGSPCPQGNGTAIGSIQQFTILCGSDIGGSVINSTTFPSTLGQCADACASFHPKCEGASFDGTTCTLKAGLASGSQTTPSTTLDAVVGQFPQASSNCATLGSSAAQGSMNFNLFCNNIIAGDDMTQLFSASFEDCMSQCSTTPGCGGVSYDATFSQGFKNCYMKTAGPSAPIADTGIDSAVVGAAAAPDPPPAPAPVPISSSSTAETAPAPAPTSITPSAETTASAVPATTSTTGGSFSTPSTVMPTGVTTQTIVSVVTSVSDSVSQTIATTELITVTMASTTGGEGGATLTSLDPATSTSNGAETLSPSSSAAADGGAASNSRAWIAAPVVGSVAAVMVVAVMFFLWGRRRRGSGRTHSSRGNSATSSPVSPSFLSRLPFGLGTTFRSLGSSSSSSSTARGGLRSPFAKTQLPFGNYWRAGVGSRGGGDGGPATSSSRGGGGARSRHAADEEAGRIRSSEHGGSGQPSMRESTPQYEVKGGKMALREDTGGPSRGGALDGIPGFLRE